MMETMLLFRLDTVVYTVIPLLLRSPHICHYLCCLSLTHYPEVRSVYFIVSNVECAGLVCSVQCLVYSVSRVSKSHGRKVVRRRNFFLT